MTTNYVVFDLATGDPVRWGPCQLADLELQAGAGQRALATQSFNVSDNRQIIWEQVRALRAVKVGGGAATPSGIMDTDELARSNIAGAALAAVIAQGASAPYSVTWTRADNSTVSLNATEMIAVGLAVMQHVDGCYNRARTLRDAINAAANMAALLAIDINTGWPSV
jgi:hypothetical protein